VERLLETAKEISESYERNGEKQQQRLEGGGGESALKGILTVL
jgi:hypothetical protein